MTTRHPAARLKILVLSTYPPDGGGGELQTLAQLRALARRGHDIQVIDLRPRHFRVSLDQDDSILVHRISTSRLPFWGGLLFHFRLVRLVIRFARQVDVAQFNHIGTAMLSAGIVLRLLGIPRIVVIWGSAAPGVGPFRSGWRWRASRRIARGFEQCVSLASAVTDNLVRAGFDRSKISFVPNGVDVEVFAPRRHAGHREERPTVVCVGRLVPAKGIEVLLDAWDTIRREHPGAVLMIAGDGPLRRELEAGCHDRFGSGSVRFLGSVSDVPALLRASQVYVSASHTEGMSNALLEAMASGLPVVVTKVGAAADLVEHARTGFLVEPGDPAGLIREISVLLRDDRLRRTFGERGREIVESSFSLDAIASRYEDLYRQLSRARRHSPRTGKTA